MTTVMITLFIAGVLGIIAHGFKEASRRNKNQEPKYSILNYWTDEFNSIMFTLICLFVISYYNADVKQIKELPTNVVGPLYFALGYMGDSVFPSLFNMLPAAVDKLKTIFNLGDKTPPTQP